MSTMEPMYGIPATIRYAISAFHRWNEADIIASVLNEVRELLNEHAGKLTIEQIKENMEYISNMKEYMNNLVDVYHQIGINLSQETINRYSERGVDLGEHGKLSLMEKQSRGEENVKVEYSLEQKFFNRVLADCQMEDKLTTALLTLKALDIAKEELGKYIQKNPGDLEEVKVLNRNNGSINE